MIEHLKKKIHEYSSDEISLGNDALQELLKT